MAKLNKQEVNAIAGKLHRELSKAAEESREQAIMNYNPSEMYSIVKNLIEKRNEIDNQIDELKSQRREVVDQAEELLQKHYGLRWSANGDSLLEISQYMINHECQLKKVPSVEELKDEVTIAAIDDDFNTASFIDEQLSKFQ